MTVRSRTLILGIAYCVAVAGCAQSTGSPPSPYVAAANTAAHPRTISPNYRVLHYFGASMDGQEPETGLVAANGVLYGTTNAGGKYCGPSSCGTVYSITPSGQEHVLFDFGTGVGAAPSALIAGTTGMLYGTLGVTGSGVGLCCPGLVYDLTTSGSLNLLYAFPGPRHGYSPNGLTLLNGTLYGTTSVGGNHVPCCAGWGGGTVFSLTTSGQETVLHSFGKSSDGVRPHGGLLYLNGSLYGVTSAGGKYTFGTVFGITPSGTYTLLHSFKTGETDGSSPYAGLTAVNGILYGTTTGGGITGSGTVFSITTNGQERVLHSFSPGALDGQNPYGTLVELNNVLYGTTVTGGKYNNGTIFSITTAGDEKVLYSFKGGKSDGSSPVAGLAELNGTLYGTTEGGGKYATSSGTDDGGIVFAFVPNAATTLR